MNRMNLVSRQVLNSPSTHFSRHITVVMGLPDLTIHFIMMRVCVCVCVCVLYIYITYFDMLNIIPWS